MLAVLSGERSRVRLLLESGADLNVAVPDRTDPAQFPGLLGDCAGWTALSFAGSPAIYRLVLPAYHRALLGYSRSARRLPHANPAREGRGCGAPVHAYRDAAAARRRHGYPMFPQLVSSILDIFR